jgi:signal transduction histidine kinase
MDDRVRLTELGELGEIADLLSDAIIVFDRDLRVRFYNASFALLYGLEPGVIAPGDEGAHVLRILGLHGFPGTDAATLRRRLAAWRLPASRAERCRLKDGRLVEVARRETADGGMIELHALRPEPANAELERQGALLESILANIGDGVALVDESLRFIAFNRRFPELYAIPEGAVRWGAHFHDFATHFGDLAGLPPERRQTEIDRRYRFLCDPSRTRVVRNLFDGRALEVVKALLPDGGAVLTARDITAEMRRRREVDEARRRAEESSRHKSSFVAHLSHEMRNSLNGILGVAALFDRSALGARERAQLELITASGRMLLRLIDDALDLSRIEAETTGLEAEPFSLVELVDEALALAAPKADEKGLSLTRDDTVAPLPRLLGDPVRIKQVLMNLLSNAVKFTGAGGVHLGLAATLVERSAELTITVTDTGTGIPPEQREAVFREFFQLGEDRGRAGGAGLGLAISRRLVGAMGGTIAVDAPEAGGSRFTVELCLPLAPEEGDDA